jgi:hypothetical protein
MKYESAQRIHIGNINSIYYKYVEITDVTDVETRLYTLKRFVTCCAKCLGQRNGVSLLRCIGCGVVVTDDCHIMRNNHEYT